MNPPTLNYAPFWLVWHVDGGAPCYRHPTRASAEAEAERLARLHPGKAFAVMESVCARLTGDMLCINLAPGHDIPF